MSRDNLVTRFFEACKNHRLVSILLIIGLVVIGLGKFTTSLDAIVEVSRKYWPAGQPDDVAKIEKNQPYVEIGDSLLGSKWSFLRDRGYVKFLPEKIKLSTHRAESMVWLRGVNISDFDLSTEFLLVSGDTSLGFGPVFWFSDKNNYYHFAIHTAGDYRLIQIVDGETKELIPWTHFPKIRRVLTKQVLRLVAGNGTIRLFVEGEITDKYMTTNSPMGSIGFRAADGGLTVDISKFDLSEN